MSQFSSMIQALALAVQTLADGGGPFWEADTTNKPTGSYPVSSDGDRVRTPVAPQCPPTPEA